MKTIFVITWKYIDGSGYGTVRAYELRQTAESDLQLLVAHGDGMKDFKIEEILFNDG